MADYPNFIGWAYQSQSPLMACQQLINWYPEKVETPGARGPLALYPTPGQSTYLTTSDTNGRALFTIADRTHAVMGASVYEVFAGSAATKRGAITQDSNPAKMTYNGLAGNQLLISSGGLLYYLDLATNTITQVTGLSAYTSFTHIGMVDGFFCALDVASNRIFVSPLNDTTATWDLTQFIQRTTQPDPWKAMIVIPPDIWAVGEETGDVLYDAGSSPFPLAPRPGITFRYGILAPFSMASIGNTVLWLARDKDGAGIVVQTRGFQPQPISDKALEAAISTYARTSTITDAEGWTYQQEGHTFYVLNFPSVPATWAYDTSTQVWARRGTWNPARNDYDEWSPRVHTYAFGKHLVAERGSGRMSVLDVTTSTESNGDPVRRVMVPPPLWVSPNASRLFIDRLDVILQPGLGTSTGQGADPVVMLETSQDTQTWSNQRTCSAGKQGEYLTRVFWLRNGSSTMLWVPRLTVSDPIPWRVVGAEYTGKGVRGAQQAA